MRRTGGCRTTGSLQYNSEQPRSTPSPLPPAAFPPGPPAYLPPHPVVHDSHTYYCSISARLRLCLPPPRFVSQSPLHTRRSAWLPRSPALGPACLPVCYTRKDNDKVKVVSTVATAGARGGIRPGKGVPTATRDIHEGGKRGHHIHHGCTSVRYKGEGTGHTPLHPQGTWRGGCTRRAGGGILCDIVCVSTGGGRGRGGGEQSFEGRLQAWG